MLNKPTFSSAHPRLTKPRRFLSFTLGSSTFFSHLPTMSNQAIHGGWLNTVIPAAWLDDVVEQPQRRSSVRLLHR
jgi:hypothetical protein